MHSTVHLDAAHPAAVQRFSVKSGDVGAGDLRAAASLDVTDPRLHLTILADDGGRLATAQAFAANVPKIEFLASRADCEPGPGCDRRYVALVELVDPAAKWDADVSLDVDATARFSGAASPVPTPVGYDIRVEPTGDFHQETAPLTFTAVYRETLDLSSPAITRRLLVRFSGAAIPTSGGGQARAVVTLRPEGWVAGTDGSHGSVLVYLHPPVEGSHGWDPGRTDGAAVGGDPARECDLSSLGCDVTLDVSLNPDFCCSSAAGSNTRASPNGSAESSSAPATRGSVTFVVEIRAIVLDGDEQRPGSVVIAPISPLSVP